MVNGKPVSAADISERLPHGGALERHGSIVTIGWTDGSRLTISRNGGTLDYSFAPSTAIGPSLRGLLGAADANAADDLTGRDGQVLRRTDPDFNTKLYSQFGASWRISQAESLFDYQPGESTATFTKLAIPSAEVTVASLSPSALALAQSTCAAAGVRAEPILDDCLIDVGMTGDPSFASGSAAVAAAGAQGAASAGPASPGQVTPISIGQTVSGTIASAGDQADYTFTGTAGQAVYLQAHDPCAGTLTWDLLAPGGGDLAGSLTCHDLERVVLPSEGTYTVRVNGERTADGAYSFTVLAVPQTIVTPVKLGGTVSGSLSNPGQEADYSFNGASGQAIYLEHGAACTPTIAWELHSPSGVVIASTISCNDLQRVDLPASGTYTVHFAGVQANIGPYAFSLLSVPATVVTPITLGQTLSGALANVGEQADYTFSGAAGETIHPHALGSCVDGLEWQLLGPSGAPLDFASACHDLGPDTLATAGTYTIRELGSRTATGEYSFVLDP